MIENVAITGRELISKEETIDFYRTKLYQVTDWYRVSLDRYNILLEDYNDLLLRYNAEIEAKRRRVECFGNMKRIVEVNPPKAEQFE